MKKNTRFIVLIYLVLFSIVLCIQSEIESADKTSSESSPARMSEAYGGHDHDKQKDIAVLMTVYPELAGTVLDDCRLCHTDGKWEGTYENHCDFCHATYPTEGFKVSLNAFGRDYAEKGRNVQAMKGIANLDSDSDGVTNETELRNFTQPGESDSRPELEPAPYIILDSKKLSDVKKHSQFLLINAHRKMDFYATYSGWQMYDLLSHIGGLKKLSHITVISHDGFRKDYGRKDIFHPFPRGIFYGFMDTKAFLGDCPPIVTYPETLPKNVESNKPIPGEQRLILANERNAKSLIPVHSTSESRLAGEGPFRTIMPQRRISPPDQSMLTSNPDCPNPFDKSIHHNSGDCARGVIAIAVHPLPEGTKEPDWQSRADELLQSGSIMVFGAIKGETP